MSWNATTQAMGHYLHGCANVVMTPTPQRALAALHKTQTGLLRLSAHMCVEAASLWRKQSAELLALWALPTTLRRRG